MNNQQPTFLGSVLKAIACTPNRNDDLDVYEHRVIQPARRLRQMAEALGDAKPDKEQIREVLSRLRDILEVKQVDPQEQHERFREILEIHQLEADFPEFLDPSR